MVSALQGLCLDMREHEARDTVAPFLRHDIHPLHLADAVAEALEPPASDGNVAPGRDEEDPRWRGEVVGGWRVVVLRAVSGSQLVEQCGDE